MKMPLTLIKSYPPSPNLQLIITKYPNYYRQGGSRIAKTVNAVLVDRQREVSFPSFEAGIAQERTMQAHNLLESSKGKVG
jgi:hypothetical protein